MFAFSSFATSLPLLLTVMMVGSMCEHISLKLDANDYSVFIILRFVSSLKKGKSSIFLSLKSRILLLSTEDGK